MRDGKPGVHEQVVLITPMCAAGGGLPFDLHAHGVDVEVVALLEAVGVEPVHVDVDVVEHEADVRVGVPVDAQGPVLFDAAASADQQAAGDRVFLVVQVGVAVAPGDLKRAPAAARQAGRRL